MPFPEVHRRTRGHAFYPPASRLRAIPALYETDGLGEAALVHARWFSSFGEWYLTELNPHTWEAFGWAMLGTDSVNGEWGYFDLPALESLVPRSVGGLVERDLHFEVAPARDCLPSGRLLRSLPSVRDRDGRRWRPCEDDGTYRLEETGEPGTPLPLARLHAQAGPLSR